jgi:hypothetical protein
VQKRTEITIETESLLVVSRHSEKAARWCKQCEKNVVMLTIDEAATIAGFAEFSLLHFVVTPDGKLLICFASA